MDTRESDAGGGSPMVLPTPSHVDRRLDVIWKLSRRETEAGSLVRGVVTIRNVAEESLDLSFAKVTGGVTRPGVDGYLGHLDQVPPSVVRRARLAPGQSLEIEALVGTTPTGDRPLDAGDYVAICPLVLGIGSSRLKATYVLRSPLVVRSNSGSLGAFA